MTTLGVTQAPLLLMNGAVNIVNSPALSDLNVPVWAHRAAMVHEMAVNFTGCTP